MTERIINLLVENAKPFREISNFSDEPGIYALFFYGSIFPLENYQLKNKEILYIGKTESSQKKRDADTHFKTGKTGSSTLRKTFGSLLQQQFNLRPIPRSQSDIDKGRTAHFKFETSSENQLTHWMVENLGLSFYPFPKSPREIDKLETELINILIPILNIDRKNTRNPFYNHIRSLRKQMGEIAYNSRKVNSIDAKKSIIKPLEIKQKTFSRISSSCKYGELWKKVIPSILDSLTSSNLTKIQLSKAIFDKVGNRKEYSFNLEFQDGKVANNISGSAVARDLARVLENNSQFKFFARGKHLKLKLDKGFILEIKS